MESKLGMNHDHLLDEDGELSNEDRSYLSPETIGWERYKEMMVREEMRRLGYVDKMPLESQEKKKHIIENFPSPNKTKMIRVLCVVIPILIFAGIFVLIFGWMALVYLAMLVGGSVGFIVLLAMLMYGIQGE